MDSFKILFKIIGLLLTGFLILTCTQDQTPTEPHIDYISPSVEWIYPHGGSELSGVVELRFSVYDEGGIDSACVYINGSLFGEGGHSCLPVNNMGGRTFLPSIHLLKPDLQANRGTQRYGEGGHFCLSVNCGQTASADTIFSLSWNTHDVDDGVYILEARAWDEAGNLGISPSLVVNVRNDDEPPPEDRTPPDVWWTEPDPGSTLTDTVRLRLRVYDEGEVDSVLLLKNGAAVVTIFPPYYCKGDRTNFPPCYCRGGQRGGHTSWTGEITPTTTYDKPVQQAVQATLTQAVQSNHPPYGSRGGQRGGEYDVDYLWDTRTDSDGVYVWEARAWDASGNMGMSPSLLVRVKNNPEPPPEDRTPPDVWWAAPEPGSTLQDSVVLICRFFDESSVDSLSLSKNGAAITTILPPYVSRGGQRGGEYDVDYLWDTRTDSDGVYVWEARAWDEAGNMGTSPALLVRVKNNEEPPPEDRTPPVVTWRSPEPGSVVSGEVELLFEVLDDVGVDSVFIYVNGAVPEGFALEGGQDILYRLTWITTEYEDGQYIIEARAKDRFGNIGTAPSVILKVLNNPPPEPRVLWVPDDYEKIQDAINASEDGDTVRVRSGTYREGLRLMGKNIWLESEEGPEVTLIDGTGWNDGIRIVDETDFRLTTIRGFTVYGEVTGIQIGKYSNVVVYNCLFKGQWEQIEDDLFMAIWTGSGIAKIYNCVFDSCSDGVVSGYGSGLFENSIVTNGEWGYYKNAVWNTWFTHGWNLYWNNVTDVGNTDPNENEIFENPQFINQFYHLSENSPAINAGNPEILDLDGSRSDLGVYGGPYAY